MAAQWYTLSVKAHKERSVAQLLSLKEGLEVFFPSLKVTPVNPRAAKIRPYFPGYLFVRLDLETAGSNALEWIPGVHGLVRFGGIPATMPEHVIHALRKHLQNLGQQRVAPARPVFRKGDRVRIISGPLSGYEAIFDGQLDEQERVRVLLACLNRYHQARRIKLDLTAIRKVD